MPDLPTANDDDLHKPVDGTDDTADSSSANDRGVKTTSDVLDAVLSASKSDAETSPASEKGSQASDASDADAKDANKGASDADAEDEELPADTKEKTRQSFERLRGRLKGYRDLGTIEEVQQYRKSHDSFQGVLTYMESSGLSTEDVNVGFDMMRLMKTDPEKALGPLKQYVAQIEEHLGITLPADLQERVKQGEIAEDAAKDLSRSKARAAIAEAQAAETARVATERDTHRQVQDLRMSCATAVSEWERQQATSDPDWKAKLEDVQKEIRLAFYEKGTPQTAQAAVKMAQDALATVNAKFKRFSPQRKAIAGPVDSSTATDARPKPKTSLDAINQALESAA